MYCRKCGAQVPDGNKFCTSCGAPMDDPTVEAASAPEQGATQMWQEGAAPTTVMGGGAAPAGDCGWDVTQTSVLGESQVEDTAGMAGASFESAPYAQPYDESAYVDGPQKKAGRGLVAAAVVMGLLAVLAVGAVVVVFADPFGLNLLGSEQPEDAEESEDADSKKDEDKDKDEKDDKKDDKSDEDEEVVDKDDKDDADDADDEAKVELIAIGEAPSKTEYKVGEDLDPSGLVLTLVYDNGEKEDVRYSSSNAADFSFDPSTLDSAGDVGVTVTYEGFEAVFTVEVEEVQQSNPGGGSGSGSGGGSTTPSSGSYVLPDSSTRLYSASELQGLSNWDLYIARNEIYARHGRMFQKDDLQSYFNGQSWYTPRYSPEQFDSMGLLNSTEQQNAATILSIEQSRGSEYL